MIHISPRLVVRKLRGQSAAVISDYPTSSHIIPIQKKTLYIHTKVSLPSLPSLPRPQTLTGQGFHGNDIKKSVSLPVDTYKFLHDKSMKRKG